MNFVYAAAASDWHETHMIGKGSGSGSTWGEWVAEERLKHKLKVASPNPKPSCVLSTHVQHAASNATNEQTTTRPHNLPHVLPAVCIGELHYSNCWHYVPLSIAIQCQEQQQEQPQPQTLERRRSRQLLNYFQPATTTASATEDCTWNRIHSSLALQKLQIFNFRFPFCAIFFSFFLQQSSPPASASFFFLFVSKQME